MADVQMQMRQMRKRKTGFYLMLFFLVSWIVVTLGIQFYQGYALGYGTGFGDGGRVPPEIVQKAGVGPAAAAVVAAVSHNAPEISMTEDIARLVFSLVVLAGIGYFWYLVISRIGTF
jgi:hypothetical protein